MKINKIFKLASLIAALAAPAAVHAHTIALGSTLGNPGETTIWLGTYTHGGSHPAEGSITIGGGTYAFDQMTNTLPTGLIAGTNYFYTTAGSFGTDPSSAFTSATNPILGLTDSHWQGVTISGLSAGLQNYTITGMNTDNWASWGSGENNWSASVTIPTGSVVASVPVPASLALFGLGLLGLRFSRRKHA